MKKKPIVIAIINTKGGGTKTTTSINTASFLSRYENAKVLLIDADPMQSLSRYSSSYVPAENGITHVITEQNFMNSISKWPFDDIDLIYNDDSKNHLSDYGKERLDGAFLMRKALEQMQGEYDYIVIDTTPNDCKMLEMCIVASDLIITPVVLETLAARELSRGTLAIIEECRSAVESISPIPFAKHVGFFVEPKPTNVSKLVRETVLEDMEGHPHFKLTDYIISYRAAISEAAAAEVPIFHHKNRTTALISSWYEELIPKLLKSVEVLDERS